MIVFFKSYNCRQGLLSFHKLQCFSSSNIKADELSFDEGDLLYILDMSSSDWWKARCGKEQGLIPSNYGIYVFWFEFGTIYNSIIQGWGGDRNNFEGQ